MSSIATCYMNNVIKKYDPLSFLLNLGNSIKVDFSYCWRLTTTKVYHFALKLCVKCNSNCSPKYVLNNFTKLQKSLRDYALAKYQYN